MKSTVRWAAGVLSLLIVAAAAASNSYTETIDLFKNAGESAAFFKTAYGYAVFPTIGKGGFIVGGAHGKGRVYEHGKYIGNTTVTQLSVGFQAGGQACAGRIHQGELRVRGWCERGGHHGGRRRYCRNDRGQCKRERRQEGRYDGRYFLLQGSGCVHDREGWRHVPGHRGRTEVYLRTSRED